MEKEQVQEKAKKTLGFLNKYAGRQFKPVESNLKFIRARINDGYSSQDIANVIKFKTGEWKGTKMAKFLRPETLFNSTKFESYINELSSQGEGISNDQSSLIGTNYQEKPEDEKTRAKDEENKKRLAELRKRRPQVKREQSDDVTINLDEPITLGSYDSTKAITFDNYEELRKYIISKANIPHTPQIAPKAK